MKERGKNLQEPKQWFMLFVLCCAQISKVACWQWVALIFDGLVIFILGVRVDRVWVVGRGSSACHRFGNPLGMWVWVRQVQVQVAFEIHIQNPHPCGRYGRFLVWLVLAKVSSNSVQTLMIDWYSHWIFVYEIAMPATCPMSALLHYNDHSQPLESSCFGAINTL